MANMENAFGPRPMDEIKEELLGRAKATATRFSTRSSTRWRR